MQTNTASESTVYRFFEMLDGDAWILYGSLVSTKLNRLRYVTIGCISSKGKIILEGQDNDIDFDDYDYFVSCGRIRQHAPTGLVGLVRVRRRTDDGSVSMTPKQKPRIVALGVTDRRGEKTFPERWDPWHKVTCPSEKETTEAMPVIAE